MKKRIYISHLGPKGHVSCEFEHKIRKKNVECINGLSFIWGSREIIFLKLTWSSKFNTQNFGCRGQPPLLTLHGSCCLNNLFNWSALRSFYVQKKILHVFYFHITSLICTVFKLCCPAHLFPNTPRMYCAGKYGLPCNCGAT